MDAPDRERSAVLTGAEQATALWRALEGITRTLDAMESRQLSEDDIAAIRVLLEQDRRTRWLWTTARTWALWIAAVAAGVTIGVDALKIVLKRLLA